MALPIGTIGTIPTLTVGGRVFTDLTNLIIIFASAYTGSLNCTMRALGASAGRAVTGGKTLTINAVRVQNENGATCEIWKFLYADNDVGLNSATAFTNPVYMGGNTASAIGIGTPATGGGYTEMGGLNFAVPATKYVGVINNQAATVNGCAYAYGYEA